MDPVRLTRFCVPVFAVVALLAAPGAASAALTVTLDSPAHDGSQIYYAQGDVVTALIDYPEAPTTSLRFIRTGSNPFASNPGTVVTDEAGHAEVSWTAANEGSDHLTVFDDTNASGAPNGSEPRDDVDANIFGGRLIPARGEAITSIAVGDNLWCQANYAGDESGEFFGGFPASCTLYIRVGGTTYTVTPVSQSPVTGDGSSATPYTVTTTGDVSSLGLTVTHVVTYVTGEDTYRTAVTLTDTSGSPQTATIAQYADCYLGNDDAGFGYLDASSGGVFCTKTRNNSPADRLEGFIPLNADFTRMEGHYSTVRSWISSHDTFPNTCDCDLPSEDDNGAGLAWVVNVPANGSVTRSFLTGFSPVGSVPEGNGAGDPGYLPPPAPEKQEVQSQESSSVADLITPPLAPVPPPVVGETGNVEPVSGTILVRLPGSLEYIPIQSLTSLPVGTLIDATLGVVHLTIASDTRGGVQTGEFSLGKFRFDQHLANGSTTKLITNITMAGGKWNVCATNAETRSDARASSMSAEAARRRVVRYLLAKAEGNFKVVGRDATGIERGTAWETLDTCKSTEVRVMDGSVLVTDLILRKKVIVSGGNTYAAHDDGTSQHKRRR